MSRKVPAVVAHVVHGVPHWQLQIHHAIGHDPVSWWRWSSGYPLLSGEDHARVFFSPVSLFPRSALVRDDLEDDFAAGMALFHLCYSVSGLLQRVGGEHGGIHQPVLDHPGDLPDHLRGTT